MEALSLKEIAACLGAKMDTDQQIIGICTDSRKVTSGVLFVALVGERFDGHDYVAAALNQGAACAIIHRPVDLPPDAPVIMVKDTQKALLDIAALYRSKLNLKIVAVTGSVGKTTTKDMIAQVVAAKYKTHKTQGNENNEIGVPHTLFALDSSHQAAVLELGMCNLGEIEELALAVRPCIGVITNIGVSHMENLGSRENILKAKLELRAGLPDGAPLLLCGDNDLLSTVEDSRFNIIFYGLENPRCAIKGDQICEENGSTRFTLHYEGRSYPVVLPCVGRHNVLNALAAFGVGQQLGIDPQACVEALAGYQPSGMRQRVVQTPQGYTVVEDCYNASPDSMQAALATLKNYPRTGRRIAVLADMLELGVVSDQSHRAVGINAAACADLLFTWGQQATLIHQAAIEAGMTSAYHFAEKEELAMALLQQVQPGDVVWFKGSRGMRLEEIISRLYGECKDR